MRRRVEGDASPRAWTRVPLGCTIIAGERSAHGYGALDSPGAFTITLGWAFGI